MHCFGAAPAGAGEDSGARVPVDLPCARRDRTGSGLHLHLSLTSGGSPTFPGDEDERGLGLSPTAYSFIGGILDHACALQALVAPTVNSYKRTGAISTASGASWAPRTPTYGGNDRTHYIRVPDSARIELRGGDGSANPYLAIAAALGAGIDGIKRSADPGAVGAPGRSSLPPTLLHAVDEVAPAARATLLGIYIGALGAGRIIAPLLGTRLYEATDSLWASCIISAIAVWLAALIAWRGIPEQD